VGHAGLGVGQFAGAAAAFFLWFFSRPTAGRFPAGAGLDCFAGRRAGDRDGCDCHSEGPGSGSVFFLSVFDVHVNRSPIGGVLTNVRYQKGQYLNAMNPASADRNEQNAVTVRGEGMEVTFKQIAGLLRGGLSFNLAQATRWNAGSAWA